MEICDLCGKERAQGVIILRHFHSVQDTSYSACWSCFARFKQLTKILGGGGEGKPISSSPSDISHRDSNQE